ncbi:Excreted virulence factor EspC, type VII ESX diderm [Actinopolyspora xinjiangensis]|uniref:Excreted virulence factor EspC, type VII ESX diderm n=1 Tax=Actinopolyspora xinjiangensis TaxID=405564 RepID=A0A1H0WUY5_9ACTN|nr:type VII secretion target [Actinopolyspora xinjiangensis]SDP94518.1 Excreted virulence factor EspC, type VII ESX diderm [Actinopolyspora xinjiangensis]
MGKFMNFRVNPESVQGFSERLNSLVDDSRIAQSYCEEWLSFGYSEGRMFIAAVEAAEDAKRSLVSNYQRLAEVQRSAAAQVEKAANLYEQTDRGEAARLDSSYRKTD